jgi:hypothetical protein
MHGRQETHSDPRHLLEHNLSHCPISLGIMRHPVYTSDGINNRRYELRELLNHFKSINSNISPVTRKPITYVGYDRDLKTTLDAIYGDDEDRESNYEHKALYDELVTFVKPQQQNGLGINAEIASIITWFSAFVIGAMLALPYHSIRLNVDLQDITNDERLSNQILVPYFLLSVVIGFIDYAIRTNNNNTHGIMKSMTNAGQALFRPAQANNQQQAAAAPQQRPPM